MMGMSPREARQYAETGVLPQSVVVEAEAIRPDRVKLIVYVDLDPVPGPMHSIDSAQNTVRGILHAQIPHYNPMVTYPSQGG